MIDTHCHIDLYDDPIELAHKIERSRVTCVAVTMLPSHYKMGKQHLTNFRKTHASLGLHPLRVVEGQSEINEFLRLSESCEFIGEVGLDFSSRGKPTKGLQVEVLSAITESLLGGKFVSVHSRDAYVETVNVLEKGGVGPVCFHYFNGGIEVAKEIADLGHFFSFNQRMLRGKHRDLVSELPRERILVESDGPFLTKSPFNAISFVYRRLAEIWKMDTSEVEAVISTNFSNCRTA